MTHVLVRPLTSKDGLQSSWIDGRPMEEVAAEFIKPNDRLSAFERLQLYNRMYWFRLIDCVYDDNPACAPRWGEKIRRIGRGLSREISFRSFTLRNLCSRLEQFIREEPRWTAPRTRLALDVARFEWAQTVAFDEGALPCSRRTTSRRPRHRASVSTCSRIFPCSGSIIQWMTSSSR